MLVSSYLLFINSQPSFPAPLSNYLATIIRQWDDEHVQFRQTAKVHASACATLAFDAAVLLSCAPPPSARQDGVFNPGTWTHSHAKSGRGRAGRKRSRKNKQAPALTRAEQNPPLCAENGPRRSARRACTDRQTDMGERARRTLAHRGGWISLF